MNLFFLCAAIIPYPLLRILLAQPFSRVKDLLLLTKTASLFYKVKKKPRYKKGLLMPLLTNNKKYFLLFVSRGIRRQTKASGMGRHVWAFLDARDSILLRSKRACLREAQDSHKHGAQVFDGDCLLPQQRVFLRQTLPIQKPKTSCLCAAKLRILLAQPSFL